MAADYELECEILVPKGIKETFAFFENPRNLARITPPWLRFVVLSEGPVEMRAGAEIDYTIRYLGVSLQWKTLIAEYEPPFHFVDVQMRGPYKRWRHTHTFRPTEGGTVVRDHVEYALPMGPIGRLAHRIRVRSQLREIFAYRQAALTGIFRDSASVTASQV